MRLKFIVLTLILVLITSCSLDNDNQLQSEAFKATILEWHLTNVSGGIAGVDIDYELDTIVWIFNLDNTGNGELQIENNNKDISLEDGLDTGKYPVFVAEYDMQPILFINGDEFAGYSSPTINDLIINQNIHSDGSTGSDGFIYTFKLKEVTESVN